jgi:hypothetical protein
MVPRKRGVLGWREGYDWNTFRVDALAGLTVAIVALPLSMAIAIAARLPPIRGLYTAMGCGFLVPALGGSRLNPNGEGTHLGGHLVARVGGVDCYQLCHEAPAAKASEISSSPRHVCHLSRRLQHDSRAKFPRNLWTHSRFGSR